MLQFGADTALMSTRGFWHLNNELSTAFKRIESLITRPAESLDDPEEREAEFQRRLERTRHLMHELDDPQSSMDIIHVGGTSGKGSISILCESMLKEMGHRVGTHTSPYLQTPLEKARVNGKLISAPDAIRLVDRVRRAWRRSPFMTARSAARTMPKPGFASRCGTLRTRDAMSV